MSEKYVNYYIDLITKTMQDAVLRNVSLQTNLKISEEVVSELTKQNEELSDIVESLRNETSSSQQDANETIRRLLEEKESTINNLTNEKDRIINDLRSEKDRAVNSLIEEKDRLVRETREDKDRTINDLRNEIGHLNNMRNEYESVKHQVHHVDTFRNELVKERADHERTRNDFEFRLKSITEEKDNAIKALLESHESKLAELNSKIDYLQLTPAKRKKIDDAKKAEETFSVLDVIPSTTSTEDGGTF
jgi:chromosome segregation ATPase